MEAVVFMPIRLNSQRVKNKNIRLLGGRPLLNWSLETLDKLDTPIVIYTNWIDVVKEHIDFSYNNIEFMERPEYLDNHDITGIDIYKEFVNSYDSDVYLLTHCTSPFVSLITYAGLLSSVISGEYDSSLTVYKIQTFCWYKGVELNFNIPRPKTQDLEPVFYETSGGYCFKKDVILNLNARSGYNVKQIETNFLEAVDIDVEEDFKIAERMIK